MGRSFTRFSGDLKPPMDTYLHASKREVNQNPVTMQARTKARISSDVSGPKISLRSHLTASNSKKFSWGSMPPDPPSFCVYTALPGRSMLRLRPFALIIVVTPLTSKPSRLRQQLPNVVQNSLTKGNVESEFSAISLAIPLLRRSACCLGSAAGPSKLLGDRFLAAGLGKQDSGSQ